MPEPLLLSLPPVRLDWPFRLDAHCWHLRGRVIVPVDIAAFLRRAFRVTPMKVTLCGVALSAFVSSITAAILILDEQTLLAMRTWLAGDLAGRIGRRWVRPPGFLWGFVLALYLAPSLNMLALGDRMAQGLGVSVLRTRTFTLLAIALLCGAAVSIAGPIGFVGLLVPQIVRRLVSADLRVLLPLSACVGALLLLLADIIAGRFSRPMS